MSNVPFTPTGSTGAFRVVYNLMIPETTDIGIITSYFLLFILFILFLLKFLQAQSLSTSPKLQWHRAKQNQRVALI